jgi:membrane-bound acyltransferase YfiQ involved in biofilm formation
VPLLKKLWFVFVIASIAWRFLTFDINAGYTVVYSILCFAGLLGFAYAFPRLKIKTDISYEIYLLHMTAVNALIQAGMRGNIVSLFVVVIATCIVGWFLWATVGKQSSLVKSKV